MKILNYLFQLLFDLEKNDYSAHIKRFSVPPF